VPRYRTISLQYRTANRDSVRFQYGGVKGQIIQHCINHLDGQLLIDYSLSHGRFFI
jgi:peptide deformylase